MRVRPGGGTAPWGFPPRARATTRSQPRAWCRGGSRVLGVWHLRHAKQSTVVLLVWCETVTACRTTGARTTKSAALGRISTSLAARRSLGITGVGSALGGADVGSALGVAGVGSARAEPAMLHHLTHRRHSTHGGAHRRARASHTTGARTTRSAALGRLDTSLAARRSLGVADVGSALGVAKARAPSRRCDPRHVGRRLRQPRDAAGARPHGRLVALAKRAPAAARARLSDRRSARARPLGRAPLPL